jgi:hypothetical protein
MFKTKSELSRDSAQPGKETIVLFSGIPFFSDWFPHT